MPSVLRDSITTNLEIEKFKELCCNCLIISTGKGRMT